MFHNLDLYFEETIFGSKTLSKKRHFQILQRPGMANYIVIKIHVYFFINRDKTLFTYNLISYYEFY